MWPSFPLGKRPAAGAALEDVTGPGVCSQLRKQVRGQCLQGLWEHLPLSWAVAPWVGWPGTQDTLG